MKLITKFISEPILYDGTQLSSHWIYKNFDILGHAIVAFMGPCDVSLSKMVDLEDVKKNSPIYSQLMLHFIGEFFDLDLEKTVYRQRLLMAAIKDGLEKLSRSPAPAFTGVNSGGVHSPHFIRYGDDLFDGDFKLTVSIATSSSISTLIHAGINIDSQNTPVPTRGLQDYGFSPEICANEILERFKSELESSWLARCKVKEVN